MGSNQGVKDDRYDVVVTGPKVGDYVIVDSWNVDGPIYSASNVPQDALTPSVQFKIAARNALIEARALKPEENMALFDAATQLAFNERGWVELGKIAEVLSLGAVGVLRNAGKALANEFQDKAAGFPKAYLDYGLENLAAMAVQQRALFDRNMSVGELAYWTVRDMHPNLPIRSDKFSALSKKYEDRFKRVTTFIGKQFSQTNIGFVSRPDMLAAVATVQEIIAPENPRNIDWGERPAATEEDGLAVLAAYARSGIPHEALAHYGDVFVSGARTARGLNKTQEQITNLVQGYMERSVEAQNFDRGLTDVEGWHVDRAQDIAQAAGVDLTPEALHAAAKEVVAGDLSTEQTGQTLSRALRATGQAAAFVANRAANRLGVQNIDVAPEDLAAAAAPFAGRADMTLDEAVNQTAKHFEKGGYGLDGALSGRTVGELKAELDATIKELNALHAPVENLGELPPVNRPGNYAFAALGDDFGALSTTPAFTPEHRDAMKKGATLNAFGKPADLYSADKWVDQTLAVEALVAQGLDRQWSTDTVSLFSDNGVTDAHALGGNLKDAGLQSTLEDRRNTGLSITSARDLVRNSVQASTYAEAPPSAVADNQPISGRSNLLEATPKSAPSPSPAETESVSLFGESPAPEPKAAPPKTTPQEQVAQKNLELAIDYETKKDKRQVTQTQLDQAATIKETKDAAAVSQRAIKEDPSVSVAIGTTEKVGDVSTTTADETPVKEPKAPKTDRSILSEKDPPLQEKANPAIPRPPLRTITIKSVDPNVPSKFFTGVFGERTGGLWNRGAQTVQQVRDARAAIAEAAKNKGVRVTSGMMDYFAGEVARDPVNGFQNALAGWERVHGVDLSDNGSDRGAGGSSGGASSSGGTTGRKSPEDRVKDKMDRGMSRRAAERSVWGG